jgi:cysteine-rich repeat protein
MKKIIIPTAILIMLALAAATDYYWTFQAPEDFNNGTFVNMQAVNGYLELSTDLQTLRYLWVANAAESSVSKIDTVLNAEVARYWTGSHPATDIDSPSRTAVDSYGNVWIGNRLGDRSAVSIAGYSSFCVDRDFSGTLSTSYDANSDGSIQLGEMLPWTQDECVIRWRNLTTTSGYGPRAVAIDLNGYVWVGLYQDRMYVKLDPHTGNTVATVPISATPYGAIVDGNGYLWSANRNSHSVTQIDTETNQVIGTYPLRTSATMPASNPYGISVDRNNKVWISLWGAQSGGYSRGVMQINGANPTQQRYFNVGTNGRGITVDFDGNVWLADSGTGRLYKLAPSTTTYPADLNIACSTTSIGSTPIGTVVDGQGNIWVMSQASNMATKIDPTDCSVMATVATGLGPYTYSDATGAVLNQFIRLGTWTITLQSPDMVHWTNITWDEWDNGEDNIILEKRTLEEAAFTQVSDGELFDNVSTGLVIRVTMQRNSDDSSPKLDNLRIGAQGPIFCIGDGTISMADRSVEFNFSSYPGHEYYLSNMVDSIVGLPCSINDLEWTVGTTPQFGITGPDAPGNISIIPRDNWTVSVSDTVPVASRCVAPACYTGSSSNLFGMGNVDVVLITDFSGSMKKAVNSWEQGYTDNNCLDIYDSQSPRKTHLAKCVDQDLVSTVLNYSGNRVWPVFMHDNEIDYYTGDPESVDAVNSYIRSYGPQGTDKTCLACALNRAYEILSANSNPSRPKVIVLMTDGVPTHCADGFCGSTSDVYGIQQCEGFCDSNGMSGCGIIQGCDDSLCLPAEQNTVSSANRLINDLDTKIYTIAFGVVQDCTRAQSLLGQIASSSGGEYYHSNSTQELRQIYMNIAHQIVSINNLTAVWPGPSAVFTGTAQLSIDYQLSSLCGNMIPEPGEECDELSIFCINCNWTSCGDGILQTPNGRRLGGPANDGVEQCDAGINNDPSDGCHDNCTFASVCGNSVTEILEECDDGNTDDTDTCTSLCLNARCGDGYVFSNGCTDCEECDLGALNALLPNRCRPDCSLPACGDAILDSNPPFNEQCDDGANGYDMDGCNDLCQYTTTCGNGIREGVEQCDMGILNSDLIPDRCRLNCHNPICGDGIMDSGETCDDGNTFPLDGCDSACQIEPTILGTCPDGAVNQPWEECDDGPLGSDSCTPWCRWTECGDGIEQSPNHYGLNEECDDGNINNTDFCSNTCEEQCVWASRTTNQDRNISLSLYPYVSPVFPNPGLTWTTEGETPLSAIPYPHDVFKIAVPPGFTGTDQINLTATDGSDHAMMCFNFHVTPTPVYGLTFPEPTRVLVSKSKLVQGYEEDSLTGEFNPWGPYIIMVKVWEK